MASDLTSRLGGARSSLAFKAPVRLATTENITLSGFQTIDGVLPTSTDTNLRILVKDQTVAAQNGIYVMSARTWARDVDFDGSDDIRKGTRIYVANGTVNANTEWIVATADPITIGTTSLSITAGGLSNLPISLLATLPRSSLAYESDYIPVYDVSASALKKLLFFRESVDVRDFGAVCDGATDDTTAIQAAIDYCLTAEPRPYTLVVSGRCLISASLIVNRTVDATTSEFRIVGNGAGAGFYATTAVVFFSSSTSMTTAPVSEHLTFENILFESSSAALASSCASGKFFRMKYRNCVFRKIKLVNSSVYLQTWYLEHCTAKFWTGTFLAGVGSFDVSIVGSVFEFGESVFYSVDATTGSSGVRLISNIFEGSTGSFATISQGRSVEISGNYLEANDGVQIELATDANPQYAVNITSNVFFLSTAQKADAAYFAIKWGNSTGRSGGNYTDGRLHDFSSGSVQAISGVDGDRAALLLYKGGSNTFLPSNPIGHAIDVASAGTINLDASIGDLVDVTGTTSITAVTLADGRWRTVRFTGALTLTHGSSLVLPGAQNIVTAAGDIAIFRGYASSVVRLVGYQRADSHGLIAGQATIASATTTDLGSVREQNIDVSGTTTITSFGSSAPTGALKTVRFSGALTLTHNATTLIIPGAGNILTVAGDCITVRHEGSGNWRVLHYTPAGIWAASTPTPTASSGTFTSVSSILHVRRIGKTVHIGGSITMTTVGTASGTLQLALPDTAGVTMAIAAGNASTGAAALAWVASASATLSISPPASFTDGHVYYFGGCYETA